MTNYEEIAAAHDFGKANSLNHACVLFASPTGCREKSKKMPSASLQA